MQQESFILHVSALGAGTICLSGKYHSGCNSLELHSLSEQCEGNASTLRRLIRVVRFSKLSVQIRTPRHVEINRPWHVETVTGCQSMRFPTWWWRPKTATSMWESGRRPPLSLIDHLCCVQHAMAVHFNMPWPADLNRRSNKT